MVEASNPGDTHCLAHLAVTGIAIGLQHTTKTIQQALSDRSGTRGVVFKQY